METYDSVSGVYKPLVRSLVQGCYSEDLKLCELPIFYIRREDRVLTANSLIFPGIVVLSLMTPNKLFHVDATKGALSLEVYILNRWVRKMCR